MLGKFLLGVAIGTAVCFGFPFKYIVGAMVIQIFLRVMYPEKEAK